MTPPVIEIGTGDPALPRFDPLPADGTLLLNAGTQGGYHVYFQVRAAGFCAYRRVWFTRSIRDAPGGMLLRFQETIQAMIDDGTGSGHSVLRFALSTFICPSLFSGIAMGDQPLFLEAEVREEGAGTALARATASLPFTPVCPAGDTVCTTNFATGCAAPP